MCTGKKILIVCERNSHRAPRLFNEFLALEKDFDLMIAGDHSTPAVLAGHSWHPVPFLLNSANTSLGEARGFSENSCRAGSLGTFSAKEVLPLAMAHAGRLQKYGA